MKREPRKLKRASGAFTLVELLAMMGVAAVLALVLTPALARTKPGGQSIRCFNNTRQLINAWQLYHMDNGGKLVAVVNGAGGVGGGSTSYAPWATGWLDWGTSADNTNVLFLIDDRYSRLGRYLNRKASVFQCPADTYASPVQQARGWSRRTRSYSANPGVGDGNFEQGPGGSGFMYRHIRTATDFLYPTPAETWVYMDEHPDSINDPALWNPASATAWVDFPAAYHNGACGVVFADGHSEFHKWTGSLVARQIKTVSFAFSPLSATPGDPDIHWMSYHAGRNSTTSY